jgi:hypothetical protein
MDGQYYRIEWGWYVRHRTLREKLSLAAFGREGARGGQSPEAVDVVVEIRGELFQDSIQLDGISSDYRLGTQPAYAVVEATGPGIGRKEAAK